MVFVHIPVYDGNVQEHVVVIGHPFQPHVADEEGKKEVWVAILVESEIEGAVIPVHHPAHEAARDGTSSRHVDCSHDKLVEFVWPS